VIKREVDMAYIKFLTAIALSFLISGPVFAQGDESRREIKHIAGDLYNIQDEMNTFTAFLYTPKGIILTDPINKKTANWIKTELAR